MIGAGERDEVLGMTRGEEYPRDIFNADDLIGRGMRQKLLTNFESPINFMVGDFYQKFDLDPYRQLVKIRDDISYNPATDLYITWDKQGYTHAKTYSAFAQAILKPLPGLEIDGGLRYTKEIKDSFVTHVYAFKYPIGKVIADNFRDSNISPEVTVSYHPTPQATPYASYKTGFKSGGFAISSIITAASTPGDFHFGSEKTRGFEFGGKGLLLDNKLRLGNYIE